MRFCAFTACTQTGRPHVLSNKVLPKHICHQLRDFDRANFILSEGCVPNRALIQEMRAAITFACTLIAGLALPGILDATPRDISKTL